MQTIRAIRFTDAARVLELSRWRVYQLARAGVLTELIIPGHVKLLTVESVLARGGENAEAHMNPAWVISLPLTPGAPSTVQQAERRPPNPKMRCCRVCGTPCPAEAGSRTPCQACGHVGKELMSISRSRLYLGQYRQSHPEAERLSEVG